MFWGSCASATMSPSACPIIRARSGPAMAALAQGADLLELHVTFDRGMYGPDTSSSITFSELAKLSEANRAFTEMRANPVDKDSAARELTETKALFTKSLSPVSDLSAGTVLSEDMLTLKKPGSGLRPEDLKDVLGKRLLRDVPANRLLRIQDLG